MCRRTKLISILACWVLAAGLAGCCSKPCDPTTWQKGSIMILGRSGYDHCLVKYEASLEMTPNQMCDCLYDYLRSHVGKDNTLYSPRHFKGGMREVDFWAFAYSQLIGHDLNIPYYAGWKERDKLIREMLKHRPDREEIKTRYFLATAIQKQQTAYDILDACKTDAERKEVCGKIYAIEITLRDRTLEYSKWLNKEGRRAFAYMLNKIANNINEVIYRIEDGEEASGIQDMMNRIMRDYQMLLLTLSDEIDGLPRRAK